MIAKGKKILKIPVKGSRDGGWGLTQSYKKGLDYHQAIDKWFEKHKSKTIFCFVQHYNTQNLLDKHENERLRYRYI